MRSPPIRRAVEVAAAGLTLFLIAAAAVGTSIAASAAMLGGVSSPTVAAGAAAVTPCDPDGVSVAYTTSDGLVTHVTIGALADPACETGRLAITLVDSTDASIGATAATSVPADGDTADNTVTLSISPTPAADAVAGYHLSITGP